MKRIFILIFLLCFIRAVGGTVNILGLNISKDRSEALRSLIDQNFTIDFISTNGDTIFLENDKFTVLTGSILNRPVTIKLVHQNDVERLDGVQFTFESFSDWEEILSCRYEALISLENKFGDSDFFFNKVDEERDEEIIATVKERFGGIDSAPTIYQNWSFKDALIELLADIHTLKCQVNYLILE